MKDAMRLKFSQARMGAGNPNWKGGQKVNQEGYVEILKPEHYRANSSGYVKRALLVLEEKIGRPIKFSYIPHHLNGLQDDDRPENLIEVTPAKHNTIHKLGKHWKQKRPLKPACKWGHLFTFENTYITPKGVRNCRQCNRIKGMRWYYAKKKRRYDSPILERS